MKKLNDAEKLYLFIEKTFGGELELGYKTIGFIALTMINEIEGTKKLNEFIKFCKKEIKRKK